MKWLILNITWKSTIIIKKWKIVKKTCKKNCLTKIINDSVKFFIRLKYYSSNEYKKDWKKFEFSIYLNCF